MATAAATTAIKRLNYFNRSNDYIPLHFGDHTIVFQNDFSSHFIFSQAFLNE